MAKVETPVRPVRTAPRQTPTRQTPLTARTIKKSATAVKPFNMPFDQKNIAIVLLGVAVVVVGYLVMYMSPTMSTMALTVSPIILLLGYCVIIPIGIMAGSKTFKKATTLNETPATNGIS